MSAPKTFLDLPLKLRVMVWRYVIPERQIYELDVRRFKSRYPIGSEHSASAAYTVAIVVRHLDGDVCRTLKPAIHMRRVCKMLDDEITQVFYSRATMVFKHMMVIEHFLAEAPRAKDWVQHAAFRHELVHPIVLRRRFKPVAAQFAVLTKLSSLKIQLIGRTGGEVSQVLEVMEEIYQTIWASTTREKGNMVVSIAEWAEGCVAEPRDSRAWPFEVEIRAQDDPHY